MPSSRSPFAGAALRLGILVVLFSGVPRVTRASDPAAASRAPCTDEASPTATGGPDLTADLWRLAMGAGTPVYPYDPARFVGPPVPLAILFAPAVSPLAAGMRIELEPGATPVTSRGVAPPPEPMIRYQDVFNRLTPVRRADGSLYIDLTGIYMTDVEAFIDAGGVHVAEPGRATPVVR